MLALVAIMSITGGAMATRVFAVQSPRASQVSLGNEVVVPADGLLFKTSEGKTVAKLAADKDGGFFFIYNDMGKPVVGLYGLKNGGGVSVSSNQGTALSLSTYEYGGYISIVSSRGKKVVDISSNEDGGYLSINDDRGEPSVEIETNRKDQKVVGQINILKDDDRNILWSAP